jgi:hypothetical protein
MSRPPKLKINFPSGYPSEYVCELEQARDLFNFSEGFFLVEGQGVQSFDDLVNIANQDKYSNSPFLEVAWLQPIGGG